MNRQSFPVAEIADPDLNDRGLYIFCGCDASTSRQLVRLSFQYAELRELPEEFLEESDSYSAADRLYMLTDSKHEQYVSHAVAHMGALGLEMYRFTACHNEDEQDFRRVIDTDTRTRYTAAG